MTKVPSRKASSSLRTIHGEPSYAISNRDIELAVTQRGGHMAPVRFRLGKRWVQPYGMAPWEPTEFPKAIPVLQILRGDFFCLPFGSSNGYRFGHGDTANAEWDYVETGSQRLVLEIKSRQPKCSVRKTIAIREGQRALYIEHRIEGLKGRFNFGHHAILQFPSNGGPFQVNTSPFHFGSVKPDLFSNPLDLEYGALKTGGQFTSLANVPLANGGFTSLHEYPARQGFDDLILIANERNDFAWTAATLDGYVWISLKDPRVLPSTLFWISNGGRHAAPWNSRHLGRLGLEEICGHYSDGLEISRENRLRAVGVPTTLPFRAKTPKRIRLIHLVHPVPSNFGKVIHVEKGAENGQIKATGEHGHQCLIPLDWAFLYGDNR